MGMSEEAAFQHIVAKAKQMEADYAAGQLNDRQKRELLLHRLMLSAEVMEALAIRKSVDYFTQLEQQSFPLARFQVQVVKETLSVLAPFVLHETRDPAVLAEVKRDIVRILSASSEIPDDKLDTELAKLDKARRVYRDSAAGLAGVKNQLLQQKIAKLNEAQA